MYGELAIFSGRASHSFAEKVCQHLGVYLGNSVFHDFSNGNLEVNFPGTTVREKDVFVIQTGARSGIEDKVQATYQLNRDFMEMLMMLDALKDSAARVTAVMPYYFYVRSDKKDKPRISIAAQLVSRLLETAGADRIVAMDLHSMQAQGFARIPIDQIFSIPNFAEHLLNNYLRHNGIDTIAVVAPDTGSLGRNRWFAGYLRGLINQELEKQGIRRVLHLPLGVAEKRRTGDDENARVYNIIGKEEIVDRDVLVCDDEILTGGTLIETTKAILECGAKRVFACITHGILSGKAIERIEASQLEKLIITDTVEFNKEQHEQRRGKPIKKIEQISVAKGFAQAIQHIHAGRSLSDLFSHAHA